MNTQSVTTAKVVNGTTYKAGTPDTLIETLERCRQNRTRILVTFGDTETGKSWGELNDVYGYVGRTTGNKSPILVFNERSMGGGLLFTDRILQVRTSVGNRILWIADNYQRATLHTEPSDMDGYISNLFVNGELVARCKTIGEQNRLLTILN